MYRELLPDAKPVVVEANPYRALAQAIREGARLTRPGRLEYFRVDDHGQLHACALGAALYALGVRYNDFPDDPSPMNYLRRKFPILRRTDLFAAITMRNDSWHWSRERIASWLDTLALAHE